MCGIIGYIGQKEALPILTHGLYELEYRGYDSAGIAILNNNKLQIKKSEGKIDKLEQSLKDEPIYGKIGIGHTRWATHGIPSTINAHPQTDCKQQIAVVHNGIIENYLVLKKELQEQGHTFVSNTDTEVIAHLIEKFYDGDLEKAIRETVKIIKGSYALGIIHKDFHDKLIGVKNESPLIIGLKNEEFFIASDIMAIGNYTKEIIYLKDREMVILDNKKFEIKTFENQIKNTKSTIILWNKDKISKSGYDHFMLKEIYEQPSVIEDTIRGRINKNDIHFEELNLIKDIKRIVIAACGTSWHAGLIGKYMIEELAHIPVQVEYAAEYRYNTPLLLDENMLFIAVTQSGETADTIGAIKEVYKKIKTLCICNVIGSSITHYSDNVIYTRAGQEIGVASTKAFVTQLTVFYLLAIFLGKLKKTISSEKMKYLLDELIILPEKIKTLLEENEIILKISEKYYNHSNFLYLGRGVGFPIALEGALKLKEISYIHAEGYPAAEMKHGPIALIDKNMPVVVLAFQGRRYEKILGNIEEIKARQGQIIAIATYDDEKIKNYVNDIIYIPPSNELLTSILSIIPLQLLAYHIAVKRNCEVDQPRNLAKSVTVE